MTQLWDEELDALRESITAESKKFIEQFPKVDTPGAPVLERARVRREAEAALVLRSQKAVDRVEQGPAGPVKFREIRPEKVDGVVLHMHGGGWMTGEPALTDLLHEALSNELNLAVLSVEYRLAPEHPYPAAPDDCEAAALWLIEHGEDEYGSDCFLIGGESAGAHLAAVTLLRLRDRHRMVGRFRGANLVFGVYDLGGSPSARGIGVKPEGDLLDPDEIGFMVDQFTPGLTDEQRKDPDISPLYAHLERMPRALFTVGSADHLVDDTLFLYDRWLVAGNEARLLVYPGAPHGCIGVPTVMSHWWPRLKEFWKSCL